MQDIYYISTGQKNGFYTLRHQFSVIVKLPNGTRIHDYDHYVMTLSTDADKATARAREMGFAVSKPQFTLEEIKRRKSELVQAEREALEKRIAEKQKEREDFILGHLKEGLWPFGKYTGCPFATAPVGYIMYFAKDETVGPYLKAEFPELFPDVVDQYYGEVKSKYSEEVTCTDSFSFESFYGRTNVIKLVTKSGNVLTYMGSGSFRAAQGSKMVVSFKVKSHEVYRGEKVTKIAYVKEVK
jgi:hypothetical protein